ALWRQVDDLCRTRNPCAGHPDRVAQRSDRHHHTGPAAVRRIVDRTAPVYGVIAWIDCFDVDQCAVAAAPDYPRSPEGVDELGKQTDDGEMLHAARLADWRRAADSLSALPCK